MTLNPQRTVGPYELQRPLGYGGMAEVWLGRHRESNGLAAIKMLRSGMRAEVRERFHLEQRVVVRLSHPNIVPVFDLGETYIAFAYVDGSDLRQRMRSPIPIGDALSIIRAIGSALAAAHAQNVVHCDVKPANILLDHRGTPFLTDFGIARVLVDSAQALDNMVAGTPGFMAPEQTVGRATAASDQYSLARTLLALLLQDALSPLTEVAIGHLPVRLHTALAGPLRRALAEPPDARFPDIMAFVSSLNGAIIGDGLSASRLPRQRRSEAPYRWAAHAGGCDYFGEKISRASFLLSAMAQAAVFDSAAVARFKSISGYADIGWDVYSNEARLGPITDPLAIARASDIIVLLHGLWTDRAIWSEMATGLVRDNGTAVVLVPDLAGFGLSRLTSEHERHACSPYGIVIAVREWLTLLGFKTTPTVIVGHSYSATALMCARDEELGMPAHRICITPVLIFEDPKGQRAAFVMGLMGYLSVHLPAALRRAIGVFMFRRDKILARIPLAARLNMAAAAFNAGGLRVAEFFWSIRRARPAPSAELVHCTVVTTPDDPLVSRESAAQSIAACGIPESQHFRLAYGGHFPQFMDEERPEWGARNIHELLSLIDSINNMPQELLERRSPNISTIAIDEAPTTLRDY